MENIILILLISFCLYLIGRKYLYNKLLQYKTTNSFNNMKESDYIIDNMFNININNIEANYSKKDISMVADSYNICYLREHLFSHPTDATIKLAEIDNNYKILDMGAGTGMVAIYMCKKFKNINIDCVVNTQHLYDIITNNINKNKLTERIKVYLMDFNKEIPKNKNYYDRILFLESIGYSTNRFKLLNDCVELLNTGGKIFIKTPSFDNSIPIKYYNKVNEIINRWSYNFSTINSLINDVNKLSNTESKYISFKLNNCIMFHNIDDIIKGFVYCYKNKINLIQDTFIGLTYVNEDFVLITKK
jgi:precorrin-6B methylase 2